MVSYKLGLFLVDFDETFPMQTSELKKSLSCWSNLRTSATKLLKWLIFQLQMDSYRWKKLIVGNFPIKLSEFKISISVESYDEKSAQN